MCANSGGPPPAPPHFSPAALRFLRGLARHNDREWFEPRRTTYEHELKAPMLALIAAISAPMEAFAPDHVRSAPHRSMLRIYRDTRFGHDKRPYNPRMAAWWGLPAAPRTSGAGFYLHLTPTEWIFAAGLFMPTREQLQAYRHSLLAEPSETADPAAAAAHLRSLLARDALHPALVPDEPGELARPRNVPATHPLATLLSQKSWGVHARFPPEHAFSPTLATQAVELFAAAAPLVHALNTLCRLRPPSSQAGPASPPPTHTQVT